VGDEDILFGLEEDLTLLKLHELGVRLE